MIKIFTPNDIIRYVYNETSKEENEVMSQALVCDSKLQEIYAVLCDLKSQLERSQENPSEQVLDKIRAYSRKASFTSVD